MGLHARSKPGRFYCKLERITIRFFLISIKAFHHFVKQGKYDLEVPCKFKRLFFKRIYVRPYASLFISMEINVKIIIQTIYFFGIFQRT